MRNILLLPIFLLSFTCFSQQLGEISKWDSLCITNPPCKGNSIDSGQLEFYRALYKTLTIEESKIPMYLYDSLVYNASDWQWEDSTFLKRIRCYTCLDGMMYSSYLEHSEAERQKYFASLKDSVILHFYPNLYVSKDKEIHMDYARAIVYGLCIEDKCCKKNCKVKTYEKGFIHPGKIDEYWYFILKYKGIYYYLGRIAPCDVIDIYLNGSESVELRQASRRFNKGFHDKSFNDIRQYSRRNKKILKKWKRGECEVLRSQ